MVPRDHPESAAQTAMTRDTPALAPQTCTVPVHPSPQPATRSSPNQNPYARSRPLHQWLRLHRATSAATPHLVLILMLLMLLTPTLTRLLPQSVPLSPREQLQSPLEATRPTRRNRVARGQCPLLPVRYSDRKISQTSSTLASTGQKTWFTPRGIRIIILTSRLGLIRTIRRRRDVNRRTRRGRLIYQKQISDIQRSDYDIGRSHLHASSPLFALHWFDSFALIFPFFCLYSSTYLRFITRISPTTSYPLTPTYLECLYDLPIFAFHLLHDLLPSIESGWRSVP